MPRRWGANAATQSTAGADTDSTWTEYPWGLGGRGGSKTRRKWSRDGWSAGYRTGRGRKVRPNLISRSRMGGCENARECVRGQARDLRFSVPTKRMPLPRRSMVEPPSGQFAYETPCGRDRSTPLGPPKALQN